MSLLESPGVNGVALANQLEQARFGELVDRPLVQVLQARSDYRVVEHPTKAPLIGDVTLDGAVERIAVR